MSEKRIKIGRSPAFGDILHPVGQEEFFREHYGRKPLHIPGGAEKFEDVMSWDALASILNQTAIWTARSLMLVLDREVLPAAAYCAPAASRDGGEVQQPDAARVMDLLRRGASLVANDIDTLTPILSDFADCLEAALSGKVQANLYCSWKERQAFDSHFDTHDVYAVHVAGEKLWRLYETRFEEPVAHRNFTSFGQDWHNRNRGPVAQEVLMRPGDLLYIPRGLYHDAMATSDGTIHIAFGVTHVIGMDVLEMLAAAAIDDPAFRRNMPRPEEGEAAARRWLGDLADRIDGVLRSDRAVEAMLRHQKAFRYPRGGFRLPVTAAGTRYRLAARGLSVDRRADGFYLAGGKGAAPIPAGLEAAVSWILERPGFSEDELADGFPALDAAARRRLLAELANMKVIRKG